AYSSSPLTSWARHGSTQPTGQYSFVGPSQSTRRRQHEPALHRTHQTLQLAQQANRQPHQRDRTLARRTPHGTPDTNRNQTVSRPARRPCRTHRRKGTTMTITTCIQCGELTDRAYCTEHRGPAAPKTKSTTK